MIKTDSTPTKTGASGKLSWARRNLNAAQAALTAARAETVGFYDWRARQRKAQGLTHMEREERKWQRLVERYENELGNDL
jgi:hypothetical protein